MKNYLFLKNFKQRMKEYIFIFLTATIFLSTTFTKSFSEENAFTINNVEVKGNINLSFNRETYLNKVFLKSFNILMSKILLSKDVNKLNDTKINDIKKLIQSFQILEESYNKDLYKIAVRIKYDDLMVKKYLSKKNISFTEPENVSALFFPVIFVNNEIKSHEENLFYKNWSQVILENKIITFILPLDDIEDTLEIIKKKNKLEDLDIISLVKKYDIENYVFCLLEYNKNKLNVYLKINFNNNKISKNFFYKLENINDIENVNLIIKDLKSKISDIWKQENLVNLLMPLSINLTYEHLNLINLEKFQKSLHKIKIINKYSLVKFNTQNSLFKVHYYGNPKKLKTELSKFGYLLGNSEGLWKVYLNE